MNFSSLINFYKNFKVHLISWVSYIIYEVFITGLITSSFGQPLVYFLVYFNNIIAFYLHSYLLNRTLNKSKKPFILLSVIINIFIVVATYTILTYILRSTLTKIGLIQITAPLIFDFKFILACLWRSLYFIGFSTGYVFIMKSFRDSKRAEELERKNLLSTIENQTLENDLINSQNNFLRSQINPHFLFNTLNFIYNDARKKAPIAGEAIMSLAEMMRYALKRPEVSDLVPLAEEIEQVEHLINLHKLRTSNAINFELNVKGDLFAVRFPPLILITLVENMFKHGNVTHSTQPALIKIIFKDQVLSIETINMINDIRAKESTNVGVENIKKRLVNFYKDQFTFTYEKNESNRYTSKIEVKMFKPTIAVN